ncbi:MAG: antirestriction protein [Asticcacaulis sp.]|uniref:antirestriction protein n=1 Tax=Asticcacaulis sp. TaxID=1872648 RepID=UPI003F7BEEEC
MLTHTTPASVRGVAQIVSETDREMFLPTLFGGRHIIVAETTVYGFMGRLSPEDYQGGLWDFFALAGAPLFLAPPTKERYRIACDTNGFEGEASAEAAGIIATLFTFSHLSFQYGSDLLSEGYYRLYDYAADHPEARVIFGAID